MTVDRHQELRRFAAMAMQGIYSAWAPTVFDELKCTDETNEAMKVISDISVKQAQALQRALDEIEPKCGHGNAKDHVAETFFFKFCPDCGAKL